jgi:hypothetical protein
MRALAQAHVTSMSACRNFNFAAYDKLFTAEMDVPGVGRISKGNWVGEPITKANHAARGGVEQARRETPAWAPQHPSDTRRSAACKGLTPVC